MGLLTQALLCSQLLSLPRRAGMTTGLALMSTFSLGQHLPDLPISQTCKFKTGIWRYLGHLGGSVD